MRRLLVMLLLLALVAACGKKESETDTAGGEAAPPAGTESAATERESRPAIPEPGLSEEERAIGAYLRPYFDAAGTDTATTVAPGDFFDVYVFAEYHELYQMNAAEYKIVLPPEVSVMGTVQTDSTILSLGKAEEDFMIAFHCLTGPKNMLVKYTCKAHEGFTGGVIEIEPGENMDFLGFTMCDVQHTLVRALGGRAEVSAK